jgi:cytochrome c-type biogenesis protein CcmE
MDFEKSEQIVVIGKMKGDIFYAKDILTKCPSKYSDTQTQEVK